MSQINSHGLQNRFPPEVRQQWHWWYSCLVCGKNGIEDLHHIISPSTRYYVAGDHNRSILNSCPIHNRVCHINNDSYLHRQDVTTMLLDKVVEALDFLGYVWNERDKKFFIAYKHLYGDNTVKMVKL